MTTDHSPDTVKFPDISVTALLRGTQQVKCYSYHARILVLLSVVGAGMQQCMITNHIFNI